MAVYRNRGFTLIELVLTIAVLGILAVVAINRFMDFRTRALLSSELGTAGAVSSGISIYGHESTLNNRSPVFPATLDSATFNPASSSNPLFRLVLADAITSGWSKNANDRYTGPASGVYRYDAATGVFQRFGTYAAYSNFDSGASGWTPTMGNVSVQSGQYVIGTGESRSFTGSTSMSNYTIDTQATLTQGQGYGVFFRVTNATNMTGYSFQYDPGYNAGAFIMRQWVNGAEQGPFAVATPPAGFQWIGTSRRIQVVANGNTFTASVDGQQVLTGTNSAYATGQVGVRTWGTSTASFDNFQVTTTP